MTNNVLIKSTHSAEVDTVHGSSLFTAEMTQYDQCDGHLWTASNSDATASIKDNTLDVDKTVRWGEPLLHMAAVAIWRMST